MLDKHFDFHVDSNTAMPYDIYAVNMPHCGQ